jgi:hypothetical protein
MRGPDHPQTAMFSCLSIEERIPVDHPLRTTPECSLDTSPRRDVSLPDET